MTAHPNGFIPISEVTGPLPWNAAVCACGSLRDYRAKTCRPCFLRPGTHKWCTGCQQDLPTEAFYRRANGDMISRCKSCVSARGKTNRVERIAYSAKSRARPGHYKGVSDHIRARLRRDPEFHLAYVLRRDLRSRLRRVGAAKSKSTVAYLGCTIPEFRAHIERQWRTGMSWANWGRTRDCWQIDHRRPVASFNLLDPRDVEACFHFSNMQPLWAPENAAKRATWAPDVAAFS